MEYIENPPDAESLMVSARSFGNYDLAGALADLIDNSIKARATFIKLQCEYQAGDPEIRVVDNGHGMLPHELRDAMRPANTNPSIERSPDDLGRFGWGMKSASFSQCSYLTVISRRDGELSGASWDLADLSGWKMGVLSSREASTACSPELNEGDGTEVIWTRCDRLSEDRGLRRDEFNDLVAHTKNRLAMIFHRFIGGKHGARKLRIDLNGRRIPEFDPFYSGHEATQALQPEVLQVSGASAITVQPFILPHFSKLKGNEQATLEGEEGLIRNQGFYVYRNNRLIIHGTWFRLAKFGELSQLIRVSVDIPNSLDSMWKITVDKSDAQLPSFLRNRLKQVVSGLRPKSTKVFRSKGGRIDNSDGNIWIRHVRNGEIRYSINKEHPLIDALLENLHQPSLGPAALQAIEQTFPVDSFGSDVREDSDSLNQTAGSRDEFMNFLRASVPYLLAKTGGNKEELVHILRSTDPYARNWHVTQEFLEQEGYLK